MKVHLYILLFLLFVIQSNSDAQIHCGTVELTPNTSINSLLTFDTFSKYQGGIIINSVAKIRVNVTDKAIVDPLCSWSLTMEIDNNAGAGTPVNEWEELTLYGNGNANNPPISLLEIRVRNNCATSPINGTFQTFTNNLDVINLIAPLLAVTPAGSCAVNVNGVGNYLTNYNEYNFNIDIRVNPNFTFNPGIFQLNIKFHLEENP